MFLVGAIKRGLLLKDFEEMTIGMMMDYFREYDEWGNEDKEDGIVEATQEDMNNF